MLFPTLKGQRFGYLGLNALAERYFADNNVESNQPNPFLDVEVCGRVITDEQTRLGLDYSFGTWLEDRQAMLRGSYLDETGNYIHLGVDFNVPYNTPVGLDHPGTVIRIDSDAPDVGGWGSRVIISLDELDIVLIYAHLDPAIAHKPGDHLKAGDIIAHVGQSPDNGGWFPHLHVQAVKKSHYAKLLENDLRDMDGYGHKKDLETLARNFPDPINFVSLT